MFQRGIIFHRLRSVWCAALLASALLGAAPATPVSATEVGGLIWIETQHEVGCEAGTVPSGIDIPTAMAISPDGLNLYVTSDSSEGQFLVTFRRDPGTGGLTPVQILAHDSFGPPDGLSHPLGIIVSPDSRHVYATNYPEDEVGVWRVDETTGALTLVEVERDGFTPLGGAVGLAISPDGAHLYVTAPRSSGVIAYSRNATTGALTWVETKTEPETVMRKPYAVAVSPDGAQVYAADQATNSLLAFSRNAMTGALTLVQAQQDGVGGAEGLRDPDELSMSPDGTHLHVTSAARQTLAVFGRNILTGGLAFVEVHDASSGGFILPWSPTVSPDGEHVYVTTRPAPNTSGIVVFRRKPGTGALRHLGVQRDGTPLCPSFRRRVVISPDGAHVYAAAQRALIAYARDWCGSAFVSGDEQCDDGNLVGGDGCSAACTLELCETAPATGCRGPIAADKAKLILKHGSRDRLLWKWTRGAATALEDFGDPVGTTHYALCVYDGSAEPQPRISLAAPAGGDCQGQPCWELGETDQFRYGDKLLAPDGLFSIRLHAGPEGQAKMLLHARGRLLQLPPLPLVPPVVVQVRNTDTSACWDAEFSAPGANDERLFKARSD